MAQKALPGSRMAPNRNPAPSRGMGGMAAGRNNRGGSLPNLSARNHGGMPHPNQAPRNQVKQAFGGGVRRRGTLPTAPRAGAAISLGNFFEGGGNAMRGNGNAFKCKEDGCGAMMMPGLDDMYGNGNDGPYCKDHWVDMWVIHPMYNRPNMPECKVGVRWTEQEWASLQKIIADTVSDFLSPVDKNGAPRQGWQPRYPRPEEMDALLEKTFTRSVDCKWCKSHVSFHPVSSDLTIPGVNAAIQQG